MKALRRLTLIALALIGTQARPAVEIAFVEVLGPDGRPLRLEGNDLFGHVAIRTPEGWLHAHPARGVEIVEDLSPFGRVVVKAVLDHEAVPDPAVYRAWLGRPYDFDFVWESETRFYCSELVAKLARVPPLPMSLDDHWPVALRARRGEPGLSPDEIFRALRRRGARLDWEGPCRSIWALTLPTRAS